MTELDNNTSRLTRKVTPADAAIAQASVDLQHLSGRDKDLQIRAAADLIRQNPARLATAISSYEQNEVTLNRLSV